MKFPPMAPMFAVLRQTDDDARRLLQVSPLFARLTPLVQAAAQADNKTLVAQALPEYAGLCLKFSITFPPS